MIGMQMANQACKAYGLMTCMRTVLHQVGEEGHQLAADEVLLYRFGKSAELLGCRPANHRSLIPAKLRIELPEFGLEPRDAARIRSRKKPSG